MFDRTMFWPFSFILLLVSAQSFQVVLFTPRHLPRRQIQPGVRRPTLLNAKEDTQRKGPFSFLRRNRSKSTVSLKSRIRRLFRRKQTEDLGDSNVPNEVQQPSAATAIEDLTQSSASVSSHTVSTEDRWATAADGIDLSGNWKLESSDTFRSEYDEYLKGLGQPFLVRSIALAVIGLTTEETKQSDNGRTLWIRGTNPRGVWERSLTASGREATSTTYEPIQTTIQTIDNEPVQAEAWWEQDQTVHRSWLRGVSQYGGGSFESQRYLDGDILVCESTFHPDDPSQETARVTWRFVSAESD